VQRFPITTDKWPISSGDGFMSMWRGDGKELFFINEEKKLMAVDIKAGNTFESGIPHPLFDVSNMKYQGGKNLLQVPGSCEFISSASSFDCGNRSRITARIFTCPYSTSR
jgi:hypothetical protein